MSKPESDYGIWLNKLVANCLPIELQTKIATLQPLTKEEARKFMSVIQLAAQARGLGDHREMLKQLKNLSDAMRKSHENEREILSWVSEEPEKHLPKDGRRISTIKRNMTYVTARAIFNASPDRATAIGLQFFNTFKGTPGTYTSFDSFMKQVRRTLATFKA